MSSSFCASDVSLASSVHVKNVKLHASLKLNLFTVACECEDSRPVSKQSTTGACATVANGAIWPSPDLTPDTWTIYLREALNLEAQVKIQEAKLQQLHSFAEAAITISVSRQLCVISPSPALPRVARQCRAHVTTTFKPAI